MNVSNAVSFPMTFREALNQPTECSSCEESLRTSSDSTSGGDSSADTKSDTSVSKINATRTTGLTKTCENKASDTSQACLNKTPGFSGESPFTKSFSQFDSQDVSKMFLSMDSDEPLNLAGNIQPAPLAAETPGKMHLLPLKRGGKLDEISPGVPDRLVGLPCLGKGSYGYVYLVDKDIKGVDRGALKRFITHENGVSERQHRQAAREVYTHIECDHQNVVRTLAYHVQGHSVMLLMEPMSCDLEKFLKEPNEKITLDSLLNILEGIFRGVEYLHKELRVLHGDIKLKNVLLNGQLEAKITDFGFASSIDQPRTLSSEPPCFYMAPELTCQQREYMSEKTEVFCLGFIALQLLTGKPIYHAWVNNPNHCRKNFSYSPKLYEAYRQYFVNTDLVEQEKVNGKPVITSVLDAKKIAKELHNEKDVKEKDLADFLQKMVWLCMNHSPESRLTLTEAKGFLIDFIEQTKIPKAHKRSCTVANQPTAAKKKLF